MIRSDLSLETRFILLLYFEVHAPVINYDFLSFVPNPLPWL